MPVGSIAEMKLLKINLASFCFVDFIVVLPVISFILANFTVPFPVISFNLLFRKISN